MDNTDGMLEFDVDPGGPLPPRAKAPVAKRFRPFDPSQAFVLPPSLDEWLPQEHLARFVGELVDDHLDLARFLAVFTETRGAPPYDPRLLLRVVLYGYCIGVRSSRELERACIDQVAFRWLAAGQTPGFRTIARFRKQHLSALAHVFLDALTLCQAAGMVKLGRVALDGTKLRANASRRKAMSYARMTEKEKILAQEISDLLADADRIDREEDAKYGKNRRDDDLPGELARREGRLAKIQQAKADLEDEARERAASKAQDRAAERGLGEDETRQRVAAAIDDAVPTPKSQRNFTDPESRIMKTSDNSFHQCFNAQAVVDDAHQIIIATDMHNTATDIGRLMEMTEQARTNTGTAPRELLADAGYCSEQNLNDAAAYTREHGTEFFIATGRQKHSDPAPLPPRGRIPDNATVKQRMARKLRTKRGHATYARRKVIVEPVFGQMHTLQKAKQLLLRGLEAARSEWLLLAACHNLRKLYQHTATGATATG